MNESQKAALMDSVKHDSLNNLKQRLKYIQLQHDQSFFDYDLLKAALERKDEAITSHLLELGCRVTNPNKINSEETPLHLAMELGNPDIIRKILLSGASIYSKNQNGDTPMYAAFKKDCFIGVDAALDMYHSTDIKKVNFSLNSLHAENKDDIIHFHIAVVRDNVKVVEQYLSCGFDVNRIFILESTEIRGWNPVHYATAKDALGVCNGMLQTVLQHGADLTIKNEDGQTPLHMVYYSIDSTCGGNTATLMFTYGNDTKFINSVDRNNVSHFHVSCMSDSPDNVKKFLDKGVDVNSETSWNSTILPGSTPLTLAVLTRRPDIAELLLKKGADASRRDKLGLTPRDYMKDTAGNYVSEEV